MMNITKYFNKQPAQPAAKQASVLYDVDIDELDQGPAVKRAQNRPAFTSPGTPVTLTGSKPATTAKRKPVGQASSDKQKLRKLLGDGETKDAESLK